MSEGEELLQCYNPSCGVKYRKSENNDKACVHHTGKPVFHDAYKSWSCCKKRTTDFTEFLGFKGCTVGYHSNVKPIDIDKPRKSDDECGDMVEESNPNQQVVLNKPLNRENILERPSESLPCVELSRKILPSLQSELDKLTKSNTSTQNVSEENDISKITVGTNCKNPGCQAIYKGASSENEKCLFHPGTPIFHEGMKYWSCCQRKTSDFETFLAQAGCETSEQHLWIKKKADITSQALNQSCRLDWHQTANYVVISVYSKLSLPEECSIQANQVKLKLSITFAGNEKKIFSKEVILNGIINPEESCVEFGASKVEITLKKRDLVSWSKLSL